MREQSPKQARTFDMSQKRESAALCDDAQKEKKDISFLRSRFLSDVVIRAATGTVYVGATLACVWHSNLATVLMFALIAGICAGEFYYMLRSDTKLPNEILGILASILYPISIYMAGLKGALVVTVLTLIALLVWYVFWEKARVTDVGISFFGAAYCGLLISGGILVRTSLPEPYGALMLLLIMVSVWANDSCAYLFGSRFGKHKMVPHISPKKSWEGFAAGLCASVCMWVVLSFIPGVSMSIGLALLFGVITGMAGVLGDLAESRIKRNSGFKDSGVIMPGHGGLLDRCDSLFFVLSTSALLLILGGCIPYVW